MFFPARLWRIKNSVFQSSLSGNGKITPFVAQSSAAGWPLFKRTTRSLMSRQPTTRTRKKMARKEMATVALDPRPRSCEQICLLLWILPWWLTTLTSQLPWSMSTACRLARTCLCPFSSGRKRRSTWWTKAPKLGQLQILSLLTLETDRGRCWKLGKISLTVP